MNMWLLLLTHMTYCGAFVQIIDPYLSRLFDPGDSPLTFRSTGTAMSQLTRSSDYSIFTWVKIQDFSSLPQIFIAIMDGSSTLLQASKGSDGNINVDVIDSVTATFAIHVVGCVTTVWEYLRISLNSNARSIDIFVNELDATRDSTGLTIAGVFEAFDPSTSYILLGGTSAGSVIVVRAIQGQLVDTTFSTYYRDPSSDRVIYDCDPLRCVSRICDGPGDKSCSDYMQLTDEGVPHSNSGESRSWSTASPRFQGSLSAASDSYSFTGWFFETEDARQWRALFRLMNIPGNNGVIGERLMSVRRNNAQQLEFAADSVTVPNEYRLFAFPVISMQAFRLYDWYFVGISVCADKVTSCFARLKDSKLTCNEWQLSSSHVTLANGLTSGVTLGDMMGDGIIGKMEDQRFYLYTCNTSSAFRSIFLQKKRSVADCPTVSSPFDCIACKSEYIQSLGICIVKESAECNNEEDVCSSNAVNCSLCSSCVFSQPSNSHLCFSTCPSGYITVSGKCVGTDKVIADFKFEAITPTVSGGDELTAVNGETMAYNEGTDPIPSKHRGYYFDGARYIQLPPSSFASGNPLMFSNTVTVSMWIRPQGVGYRPIYSKKEGIFHIFTISMSAGNQLQFEGGDPVIVNPYGVALTNDIWAFVALCFKYDLAIQRTLVSFYYNGVWDGTSSATMAVIKDISSTAPQMVGTTADLTDFYRGFIWRITFRNYEWTNIASEIDTTLPGPGCPAGLGYCLSSCAFWETPDCQPCLGLCSQGCVRTTDCNLCYDTCETCTGFLSNSCTSCKPNLELSDTGECLCGPGLFPNPSNLNCASCHSTCRRCIGIGINQCSECWNFAFLDGTSPTSCQCIPNSYPSPDSSICKLCSIECLTCTGDSRLSCSSCKPNASLKGAAPCSCECITGFYPNPDSSQCSRCSEGCSKCNGPSDCVECSVNYRLQSGICECSERCYRSSETGACIECSENCSICVSTGCIHCDPSLFLYAGNCISSCPPGFAPNLILECEEADLNPPIPFLSVSSYNTLIVSFDKPMNCSLTSADISVDAEDENFRFIPVNWKKPVFIDLYTLYIELHFESEYVPAHSTANLTFLHPRLVTDVYDIPIAISSLTIALSAVGSQNKTQISLLSQTSTGIETQNIAKGSIFSIMALSFMSGKASNLIMSVMQFQLITYISMTTLALPEKFAAALAALNIDQIIPNPLSDLLAVDAKSQQPSDAISKCGKSTSVFLSNISFFFCSAAVVLSSYLPIRLLSRIKYDPISSYFSKLLSTFRWEIPLNLYFTFYLDSGVLGFLQVTHPSISTLYLGGNCILAYIFLALLIAAPIALSVFFYRNYDLLSSGSDPSFNTRWKLFLEPFSPSRKYIGIIYYFLFLIRRLCLSVTLMLFPQRPEVFMIFGIVSCALVRLTQSLVFVFVLKPFANPANQRESIIVEIGTFVIYLLAGLSSVSENSIWANLMGESGVWAIRGILVTSIAMPAMRVFFGLIKVIKARHAMTILGNASTIRVANFKETGELSEFRKRRVVG